MKAVSHADETETVPAPSPTTVEPQPLPRQWSVYLTVGGVLIVTAERVSFEGGAAVVWNGQEVI